MPRSSRTDPIRSSSIHLDAQRARLDSVQSRIEASVFSRSAPSRSQNQNRSGKIQSFSLGRFLCNRMGVSALNRLGLAFKLFFKTIKNPTFADEAGRLLSQGPEGPDLRVLAVLQRDGRLVDFLQENIDSYSDSQIGAAAPDIHRSCEKVLRDYLVLKPVLGTEEGQTVLVPVNFDPAAVRLTGNVAGAPPFRGVLRHHGWRVVTARLPETAAAKDKTAILAPAEVELS